MKHFIHIFLLLVGLNHLIFSQQYAIKNYGVSQGLSQSQVQAIAQDSLGYLWVGTRGGGISKFDGQHFTTYTKNDGLAGNFILTINVVNQHEILVGTTSGLSKITKDSIVSNFTNSPLDTLIIQELSLPYIATSSGIYYYEGTTTRPIKISDTKCGKGIYQLVKQNDTILATTNFGLLEITDNLTTCRTNLNPVRNNFFTSIIKRKNQKIWIGSLGGGLSKLLPNGRYQNFSKSKGLQTYNVNYLFEDSKQNIWIGSRGQGLSIYNNQTFTHITQENGLANNFVNTIFEDKDHNIWIGTSNGLSKYEGNQYVLLDKTSFLTKGGAYTVQEDYLGNTWFGDFNGGITRKKGKNIKTFNQYNGFTNKRVKTIHEAQDSTLWIGTDGGGIFYYKNGRMQKYPTPNYWIRDIKEDFDGTLYFASLGEGVLRLQNDTLAIFPLLDRKSNRVNRIEIDSVIWLATDDGVFYLKQDSIYPYNNIPKERYTSFTKVNQNLFFVGSIGGGVYGLNDLTYNTKNSLTSDNVYALYGEQNKLWVGTEKGLEELLLDEKGTVISNTPHTIQEGFLGIELLRNSIYKAKNNHYWFGTVNGLVEYTPNLTKQKPNQPILLVNSIELFYNPLQSSSILGGNSSLPNTTFTHTENHFTFRFNGINFTPSKSLQYKWRLIGLDNIWSTPTPQSFATYANLKPGTYTFEVQAGNESGIWSGVKSQSFTITPPFWQSSWFIGLIILASLLIIGAIIWGIIRNISQKNKANLVKLKMIELEQQASRLQMNPHFLFNSLNAIKGAVAQQETKEAKKSIDQFAKLMRAMLETTNEGFIPLAKELNLIELYLKLELLNHQFTYTVNIKADIPDNILIPAMMIQPLVENAVLHGIAPIQEKGNITVDFSLQNDSTIICAITDNGVGRKASLQAKKASVHKQESKAMQIIHDRLALLKQTHKTGNITITDLEHPTGTVVTLVLPIKFPEI